MVDAAQAERTEVDPFVADVTRLLLTFLFVVGIDAVVVALVTHRLRLWFPQWLDPLWATRADPWVIYSQSYFAGIFMIPALCRLVDRDFLAHLGASVRALFWLLCAIMFAFVLWWKSLLMLQYHKHYEVLGWAVLTGVIWMVIRLVGILPHWVRRLSRRRFLGGLLFAVALFFAVMSVVDPLLQLSVQRLPWSSGLATELGFFIPAAVVLMMFSRRLRG